MQTKAEVELRRANLTVRLDRGAPCIDYQFVSANTVIYLMMMMLNGCNYVFFDIVIAKRY